MSGKFTINCQPILIFLFLVGYVQGIYDESGRFAFVETAGRVGFMYPDGSIKTIAGRTRKLKTFLNKIIGTVTKSDKLPVWIKKPHKTVMANQEIRGYVF